MNKRKRKALQTVDAPDPPRPDIDAHEHGGAAKPVSLWPLDFDTAIGGLVGVRVPSESKRR